MPGVAWILKHLVYMHNNKDKVGSIRWDSAFPRRPSPTHQSWSLWRIESFTSRRNGTTSQSGLQQFTSPRSMREHHVWAAVACLILASLVQLSLGQEFELTISSITLKESLRAGTNLKMCFTTALDIPTDITLKNILATCWQGTDGSITETEVAAVSVEDVSDNGACSNHILEITPIPYENVINCILNVQKPDNPEEHARGMVTVSLPPLTEVPTCTAAYYWTDTKTLGVMCSLPVNAPKCETYFGTTDFASYYACNSKPDKFIPCTPLPNGALVSGEVDVCLGEEVEIQERDEDFIEGLHVKLVYKDEDNERVLTVTPASGENEAMDLVVKSNLPSAVTNDGAGVGTDKQTEYLVVKYGTGGEVPTVLNSVSGTHTDFRLTATGLSTSIIEMTWESGTDVPDNPYSIEVTTPEVAPRFSTATVDCHDTNEYCYGYFTGLEAGQSYKPTLTSGDGIHSVISEVVDLPPITKPDVRLRRLELDWWDEGSSSAVNATLCFSHQPSTDTRPENYQLTLISEEGARLRVQGAFRASGELLCSPATPLDTQQFPAASGKAWAVLVERDGQGGTVLASGESQLFFLAPEVRRVSPEVVRVSWSSPGGHTFTVRRPGDAAPLATSLACKSCSYDIKAEAKEAAEHMTVVVETEEGPLKVAAEASSSPAHKASTGKVSKA